MIRFLLVSACCIFITSCGQNESDDLVIRGTWKLSSSIFSSLEESVTFNDDNSYLIESKLNQIRFGSTIMGTISGDWTKSGNTIIFLNSMLGISNDTSSINLGTNPGTGFPIGSFYSYFISGIYQNDSTLIDGSGSIRLEDIINSDIFSEESLDERIWTIIKLTPDSLIVDSEGVILRYYHE